MRTILYSVLIFLSFEGYSQDTICKASTRFEIGLRPEANIYESFSDTLPKDVDVYVTDFKNDLWKVSYNDVSGWIPTASLWRTSAMIEILRDKEMYELFKRYGEDAGKKIYNQQVWIGMTKKMLSDSMGNPENKNVSKGSWGIHEQWVYKNKYVYIENGKVTSIQTTY